MVVRVPSFVSGMNRRPSRYHRRGHGIPGTTASLLRNLRLGTGASVRPGGYGSLSLGELAFFEQLWPPPAEGENMHSRMIMGVGILGLVGCGVFGSADDSPAA